MLLLVICDYAILISVIMATIIFDASFILSGVLLGCLCDIHSGLEPLNRKFFKWITTENGCS
jgi:hypothetical protein